MEKIYTYEQAVEIRNEWLKVQEQLPEIIRGVMKEKTIVSVAKDLKYNRTHIYNLIKG